MPWEKLSVGHAELGLDIVPHHHISATLHPRAVSAADNPSFCRTLTAQEKTKTILPLFSLGEGQITESCGVGWRGH